MGAAKRKNEWLEKNVLTLDQYKIELTTEAIQNVFATGEIDQQTVDRCLEITDLAKQHPIAWLELVVDVMNCDRHKVKPFFKVVEILSEQFPALFDVRFFVTDDDRRQSVILFTFLLIGVSQDELLEVQDDLVQRLFE